MKHALLPYANLRGWSIRFITVVAAIVWAGCPYESPVPMGTTRVEAPKELVGEWAITYDSEETPDSLRGTWLSIAREGSGLRFTLIAPDGTPLELSDDVFGMEIFVTDVGGVPVLNARSDGEYKFHGFEVDGPFLRMWSVEENAFKDEKSETRYFTTADSLGSYAAARVHEEVFFADEFALFVQRDPPVSPHEVFARGKQAFDDHRHIEAFSWFTGAAHLGDPDAQAFVGFMAERGLGTASDTAQAVRYYERAARQNQVYAQVALGLLYYGGFIAARDSALTQERADQKAVEWWKRAAAKETPSAHVHLGYAYVNGRGVALDLDQALDHFEQARDSGDAWSVQRGTAGADWIYNSLYGELWSSMEYSPFRPALIRGSAACLAPDGPRPGRLTVAAEAMDGADLHALADLFRADPVVACTTLARLTHAPTFGSIRELTTDFIGELMAADATPDSDIRAEINGWAMDRREYLPADGVIRFFLEYKLTTAYYRSGDREKGYEALNNLVDLFDLAEYEAPSMETRTENTERLALRFLWSAIAKFEPMFELMRAFALWEVRDERAAKVALAAARSAAETQKFLSHEESSSPVSASLTGLETTTPAIVAALLPAVQRGGSEAPAAYQLLAGWKGDVMSAIRLQALVMSRARMEGHGKRVDALTAAQRRIKEAYFSRNPEAVEGWGGLVARRDSLFKALALDVYYEGDPAQAAFAALQDQMKGAMTEADTAAVYERILVTLGNAVDLMIPTVAEVAANPWAVNGLDSLRALMPAGAVFVDVYRFRPPPAALRDVLGVPLPEDSVRYAAVMVSPSQDLSVVDLGPAADIEGMAKGWRRAVMAEDRRAENIAAADLMSSLWSPIARALPDHTTRVWVSPDGPLVQLPWNWLAGRSPYTRELGVAHTPSARALLALLKAPPPAPSEAILVVGDVDFGRGSENGLVPLPATGREASTVVQRATAAGFQPTALTGTSPTPESVSRVLPEVAVAHFATHGFFAGDPAVPAGSVRSALLATTDGLTAELRSEIAEKAPLIESGIALAGANDGPAGLLTAEELALLDLSDVGLLVLSACDTGRGTEIDGQGVLGMRSGLAASGARATLLSMWKVDDTTTALLMDHFYQALWERGLGPAAALREAQGEVRAVYPSPVYWAAWVIDGDGWSPPARPR